MKWDNASTEPLDVIEANECGGSDELTSRRFRAAFNEIDRLKRVEAGMGAFVAEAREQLTGHVRPLLHPGDRLVSVHLPARDWHVTDLDVRSIGVHQLPGPAGSYLVANITGVGDEPDIIVPLHQAQAFKVQNP